MGASVINESLWVDLSATNENGIATFSVYNGAWEGTIDFNRKVAWANYYPEHLIPLTSIRPAVKGECEPYY